MTRIPEGEVRSLDALVACVEGLREELLREGRDVWENPSLEDFLEALGAWMRDSPGWYRKARKEFPDGGDWAFLSRALRAATVYE
ncbi:DUF7660 family protein [Streptomyces sp. NPDC002530]